MSKKTSARNNNINPQRQFTEQRNKKKENRRREPKKCPKEEIEINKGSKQKFRCNLTKEAERILNEHPNFARAFDLAAASLLPQEDKKQSFLPQKCRGKRLWEWKLQLNDKYRAFYKRVHEKTAPQNGMFCIEADIVASDKQNKNKKKQSKC
eukprot:TRINITY_DN12538_c0_g1_i1.p1 TRINITY_DN12538_c0_g1~~TRINITY_DN12538_c0_g1_i1.p1  ORF type:complete len:152 (-),score=38.65 TRINITY_DN12538_c0_g1_i1:13-468(-)